MRRSLLTRLLTASLVIAAAAIAATAWLTTRSTTEQIGDETSRTLEADNLIHDELVDYGWSHRTWDGVDELVRQLADEHGRRIALTTSDGTMLVDSAELLDEDAGSLTRTAAAVVDPFNDRAVVASDYESSDATTDETLVYETGDAPFVERTPTTAPIPLTASDGEGALAAEEETLADIGQDGSFIDSETVALPPTVTMFSQREVAERRQAAREVATCVEALGLDATVKPGGPHRAPSVEILGQDGARDLLVDDRVVFVDGDGSVLSGGCAERFPVLSEPSARHRQVLQELDDETHKCTAELDAGSDSQGPRAGDVVPPDVGTCMAGAVREVLADDVADPAMLYLGGDPPARSTLAMLGDSRTIVTLVVVFGIALVASVLVGRRILHPVRSITNAANRMANGNRSVRVRADGRDELARLATTFNAMADSVQRAESQHRAMVSDVAHELRNPLTTMRSHLEGAQDDVVATDDRLVSSLLEETIVLQHLVDDLQDLAIAEAGRMQIHPELVNADEIAAQSVDTYRTRVDDAGIEMHVESSDAVPVMADPTRLRQAIGNLISNALRYTPRDGEITVHIDRRQNADEPTTEWVTIAVADTGAGIEPEHLPHLFDRFYRADLSRSRDTGGTGLGLAIVRHLIEAHGGHVTVESTVGSGSVFTLHLPDGGPL